jgi:hypothetical protein
MDTANSTSDVTSTVLDHVDNIVVLGNVFQEPHNEYWALIFLRDGLELLYRQAASCDAVVKNQVNPQGGLKFFAYGNIPAFGSSAPNRGAVKL